MSLESIFKAFNYRITDGTEYTWNCYGPSARYIDFESEYAHASVIYDTTTLEVYETSVDAKQDEDDNLPGPYRWLNPNYKDSYFDECEAKQIDKHIAWDDTNWIDLEVLDDWLEKASAMFLNNPFDRRIQVPLDLTDQEILFLALEAHKKDITINKFVETILQAVIDNHKSNLA